MFVPLNHRNGCISAHTRAIDKSGVPKEAQDNALSDGISADRQIPPQQPLYSENCDIYDHSAKIGSTE